MVPPLARLYRPTLAGLALTLAAKRLRRCEALSEELV
jgi:hypothetical protein